MRLTTAMLAFVTSVFVLALFNFSTLAADNHAHHMDEQMPASGAADTHADHVDEQMPASGAADTHANHVDGQMPMSGKHMGGHGHWADPAGIAGANMPAGSFMLDYRPMFMHMEGNRIGTDGVSPEFIVTNVPNPNGGPPTLRVVPTEMDRQMHMFMAHYAPYDWLTVMAMAPYIIKEMDHITFQGMAGTTRLGTFTTRSEGIGDTTLSALFRLYDDSNKRVQVTTGLSLPTGSITETGDVLAPTGARLTLRLPYPMQLGSGTFDFLPRITIRGRQGPWTYGARYSGVIRLGDNDEGYALGDIHALTAWGLYEWTPVVNTSLRIAALTEDSISGRDPLIAAPVQTAVPAFSGGERVDLFLGLGLTGQGDWQAYRLDAEVGVPIHQDLNGPQMETDYSVRVALTKMFMP